MSDEGPVDGAGDYTVGYGRPPVSTRFKKGKSGNPSGRPKRTKAAAVDIGFGSQAAEQLLLTEAYRPVTLREGDKLIEIPAIQAVFRSLSVSAVKGSRLAATALAAMVKEVETEHHRLKFEHFGQAIEYKQEWEKNFAASDAAGKPRAEPIPHPDDMHLDPNTGEVRILGPKCPEQKKKWDEMLARRDEAQQELIEYSSLSKRARNPRRKIMYKTEALQEQRIFDIINDKLPERYKTRLEGRLSRKEDLELLPPMKKRNRRR